LDVHDLFSPYFYGSFVVFNKFINSEVNLLLLVAVLSLGIYGIIFAGWASNSKYALLGSLRSAAQMISYEVSLSLLILPVLLLSESANILNIVEKQKIV
jgi:NADH-quinone oxidoreductase subunit H